MSMFKSHSLTLSFSHSFTLSFSLSQHAEQLLFSCLCSKLSVYSRKLQCFFLPPHPIPSGIHVVATTTLVAIDRTNCVCCTSRGPREVQNCGRWLPKLNAHAQSVLGTIQHCFAPLDTSRGDETCSTHNLCGQWRPRLW